MLDEILTPAFLQAASNRPEEPTVITLKALQADPTITEATSLGEITITTIKGGEASTQTSAALSTAALAIEADDQATIELSADGLIINVLGDQVELVTE